MFQPFGLKCKGHSSMENVTEEVPHWLVVNINGWTAEHSTANGDVVAFRPPVYQWSIAIVVR